MVIWMLEKDGHLDGEKDGHLDGEIDYTELQMMKFDSEPTTGANKH